MLSVQIVKRIKHKGSLYIYVKPEDSIIHV